MPTYAEMDNVQLAALKEELEREYGEIKARGLALNMARGKPAKAQLDLSMPLLETVTTMEDCVAADGTDCRNYGVTEEFGIEMIPVPMTDEGPDMDEVERIAASDASVKGIWCVPKYSNPGGTTYSDETVRRLAAMECAADDFRIFWDNAYCVHHLFDDAAEQDQLLDIAAACREAGTEDRCFKFASTSKVTFPGAGISALAASPANIAEIKKRVGVQTIGHDKLNQLRHVRFLRDAEGLAAHMAKHAAILRPKFELVNAKLQEGLDEVGGCSWSNPRGGYFVSFDAPQGCDPGEGSSRHDDGRRRHVPVQAGSERQQHPHRPHPAAAGGVGRGYGRVHRLREAGLRGEAAGLDCTPGLRSFGRSRPRAAPFLVRGM